MTTIYYIHIVFRKVVVNDGLTQEKPEMVLYAAVMVIAAVTAAFLILSYKYTGDTIRKV